MSMVAVWRAPSRRRERIGETTLAHRIEMRLDSMSTNALMGEVPVAAQDGPVRSQPLHGVWDLVSFEDLQADGKVILAKGVTGTIAYTPAGWVFVQLFFADPKFAVGKVFGPGGRLLPTATIEDVRKAFSSYYAYFGRYDIDEPRRVVTHHVQPSMRPNEMGVIYERPYDLSGDRLVLRYPVPTDGRGTNTRVLTWRRAESFHA
jgi:hypothetical protein